MKVAIAGLGAAAMRGHLPALARLATAGRVSIVGGCDPDRQRRVEVRRAFPTVPVFCSAAEMLACVDSDLLVIAAHPPAHAPLATLGAAHGQHILCEKPAGATPAQLEAFTAMRHRHPERGLAAVYQYRFSSPWAAVTRFLAAAARSGDRFTMSVSVQRTATDRHAMSNWRDDPAMGGAFADHTVHFLSLAHALRGSLEAVSSEREYDAARRERASAHVLVGSDLLDVSVSYGAPVRSTSIAIACGDSTLRWVDRTLTIDRRRCKNRPMTVPSLADRSYIDALYLPMYDDLLTGVHDPGWRRRRAQELLDVGGTLMALLARTDGLDRAAQRMALVA